MPDPLELPRVRCAVVPLVRGKGFAGFRRRVVNKLVAFALGHTFRGGGRFAGRCSGLVPGLTTVIRTLNNLSKPAARLRSVQPIRIGGRSLEMIDFPARKVGTADVPPFALCVRCEDERALARANQYSYSAHNLLLPAFRFRINFFFARRSATASAAPRSLAPAGLLSFRCARLEPEQRCRSPRRNPWHGSGSSRRFARASPRTDRRSRSFCRRGPERSPPSPPAGAAKRSDISRRCGAGVSARPIPQASVVAWSR